MAWTISPNNTASDARAEPTLNGPALFPAGPFYVQYGAVTVGNSATQTSVLTGAAVDLTYQQSGATPAKSLGVCGPGKVPSAPLGAFPLGTVFRVTMTGSLTGANASTPDLTFSLVFRNSAGTIAYTPVTSVGTLMNCADTATPFKTEMIAAVTTAGASGYITGNFLTVYGDAAIKGIMGDVPAAVAVDLTQSYYMDVTVTWGTAAANNTITVNTVVIELMA